MEALSYKPITKDQWRLHAQSFDLNGLSPFDGKKVFYAAQRYVQRGALIENPLRYQAI